MNSTKLNIRLTPRTSQAAQLAWRLVCSAALLSALSVNATRAQSMSSDAPDYASLVASAVRTDEDRRADERRKPVEFLRFAQVMPGMNVLDIAAGGGYTTQLLALAVGPRGNVWAQSDKPRKSFEKRFAAHPQPNVHPLVRGFEDPYPTDAPRVDLITFVLNYHDIAYAPVDREKMDRALFEALKPGGHLVLIDHAAKTGSGLRDTKTLHRIDQVVVRQEFERAGFVLQQESDFLRNPDDAREQAFFDMKTPTDRFALLFVRPK
jgi:predicted methyltransferase